MDFQNEHIAFTDNKELRKAVIIFTGKDDSAKQQLISKYGEISKWDVGNVTDMSMMFSDCWNFNSDISKWDVGNVTNMFWMFDRCRKFNSDISLWDVSNVSNVTNMRGMFLYCKEFNSDISKWNVSNVTDMSFMFYNCHKFINSLNGFRRNKQ